VWKLTQTGFTLQNWIDFWLDEFGVMAEHYVPNYGYIPYPLEFKYEQWVEQLKADAERGDVRAKKIIDHATAPQVIRQAHPDYWYLSVMAKYPGVDWNNVSLKERGKYIAHAQLKAIEEAYYRLIFQMDRKW
jgi:hypothetical protein